MSLFYIASLKHTHKTSEHIVFWARFHRGYTPVLGEYAGRYCFGEAVDMNDGFDCIAVPVGIAEALASPEPYFANRAVAAAHRFYDQRGPVMDNTRKNWGALIAASKWVGNQAYVPKPELFRGVRRAIALAEAA